MPIKKLEVSWCNIEIRTEKQKKKSSAQTCISGLEIFNCQIRLSIFKKTNMFEWWYLFNNCIWQDSAFARNDSE